eukprot:1177853-Pyramimonas_sp.AAC.1
MHPRAHMLLIRLCSVSTYVSVGGTTRVPVLVAACLDGFIGSEGYPLVTWLTLYPFIPAAVGV